MIKHFYLVNAFGKDRPGIVARVTRSLLELGGNIEDASMTRLGGEFAMMLILSHPEELNKEQIEKPFLKGKAEDRLAVSVRDIPAGLAVRAKDTGEQCLISVYGTDKPGIVHAIAKLLAEKKVNITDLNTRVIERPQQSLYVMMLEVRLPQTLKTLQLRKELEVISHKLGVEVTLQDLEEVAL